MDIVKRGTMTAHETLRWKLEATIHQEGNHHIHVHHTQPTNSSAVCGTFIFEQLHSQTEGFQHESNLNPVGLHDSLVNFKPDSAPSKQEDGTQQVPKKVTPEQNQQAFYCRLYCAVATESQIDESPRESADFLL